MKIVHAAGSRASRQQGGAFLAGSRTDRLGRPRHRRHDPCSLAGILTPRTGPLVAAAVALATAVGCTVDVGRLPVVSTRPVVAADLVRPPASGARRTEGRSCVWVALVAPVTPLPSLGAAIGDALDRASAAALWNAHVRYELVYVGLVGRGCYVVEGDVS